MVSGIFGGRVRTALGLLLSLALVFAGTLAKAQGAQADTEKKIDELISKLTLEEKIKMLSGATMMASTPVPRLGIPAFRMSDGPVGAHIPAPSTAYAAGIGLAASWDRELAKRIGTQIGRDARSRGASYLLGPGVNIYRAPMNGRNFEYFGEDPFLAAETAVGYIDGVQSQGVSATIKHYAANNSEYFRFTSNSVVSERALREIYLPVFEAAVKRAHVGSIMDSYNFLNGDHATQNYHLNVEIAKQDWGFDGLMMSDWTATHDGVAAANAGLDLEMPFGTYMNAKALLPAIKAGTVKEATIDDKIRRLLRVAYRFGWMDNDPLDLSIPRYNQEGRAAALQGAREGLVLLKNEKNLLPLDPAKVKTIAVIGPDAFPGSPTAGGSGEVPVFASVSALKGISDRLNGKATVLYDRGLPSLGLMAMRSGFLLAPDKFQPGLTVETFDNPRFEGKPTATRTELTANTSGGFEAGAGTSAQDSSELVATLPAEFMMNMMNATPTPTYTRWTGYYFAQKPADYTVFLEYQGRCRLKVDDKTVIDNGEVPRFALSQAAATLAPGPHKVVLEILDTVPFTGGMVKIGIVQEGTLVAASAIEMAKKADAVIVAVGYNAEIETEGADREFRLPPGQDELIEKIAAVNPNTIVAITSGGSVDASRWIGKVAGVIENWYPGQEGGTALAEVLFGDIDPSGRLPISWERKLEDNPSYAWYYPTPGTLDIPYKDEVFVGYRGYEHLRVKPLFPFGFGLSYTTFKYGGLKIEPGAPGNYTVSFDVTNTGPRKGADVAQVYVSEEHPSVPRPPQELKGFARVELEPGETRHVTVALDARAFTWFDEKSKSWHADAGSYTIRVSRSSANPQLEGKVTLAAPVVVPVNQ
ncbi:MAG: glycoside hydrolase family 3 C-terminal domain-containing protein [Terracidiphilus sp.]